MNPFNWRRLVGAVVTTLLLVACNGSGNPNQTGSPDEGESTAKPPDEGVILAGELPHIVERAGLYSLPTDPAEVPAALATLPEQLGNVIAMHLGRIYPTPYELTPGVGPLVDLVEARAGLLLGGGQLVRNLE